MVDEACTIKSEIPESLQSVSVSYRLVSGEMDHSSSLHFRHICLHVPVQMSVHMSANIPILMSRY